MNWGFKSRFHDLDEVMKFKPKSVEFHLTDEDVEKGQLNGAVYDTDYSIHLPEYWHGHIIDPCDLNNLPYNMDAYKQCIRKGLELSSKFTVKGKLKVIIHPGGMTVDPLTDEIHPIKFYKDSLYRRFTSFINYIEMIPEFQGKIEVLVENMPPLPWFFGGQYYSNIFCDPLEIKDFCDKTARNICLDISHLGLYCNYSDYFYKSDRAWVLLKSINMLKIHTKQIHLADATGTDGEGANIGEGNIDFRAVMQEIKDIDCYVIPEQMWGHFENFKEFRRTIKECSQWLT